MIHRRADLRAAVAKLVRAALIYLAERHDRPIIGVDFDLRRWRQQTQEVFAISRHRVWHRPPEALMYNWLDQLGEMDQLRAFVAADSTLASRVDTLVGTEFDRSGRRLHDIITERLIAPMVLCSDTYAFDQATFDALYEAVETDLLADEVRFIELVPINGLDLAVESVELPGDLTLRPMTEREIGEALSVSAVPIELHHTPTSVTVSRFNQCALVREQDYPFVAEPDMPAEPTAPKFPTVQDPAEQLITALRIVCGGSSMATRTIRMRRPGDLEAGATGHQALMTQLGAMDPERPAVLFSHQTDELLHVFALPQHAVVRDDGALQVALRRLGFAGGRLRPEDRLIDLMICAEALFIHQPGITTFKKRPFIAAGSEELLSSDPELETAPGEVERFMGAAYDQRNAEVHGAPSDPVSLVRLKGGQLCGFDEMVEDLDRVIRRATRLVLERVADPGHPGN